ncbi:MAG: YbaN family protein [Acidimicrobiales bacterium]
MTPGNAQPTASVARNRVVRGCWFVSGWLAVAVGTVGIVVPGLPTTVFFIIAAWCFGRSSPRFERWVLDLPRIGPMVRNHRAGLGMPRRAKVAALSMMWAAIIISAYFLRDRPLIVVAVVALGLVGSGYIVWRVPTREHVASPA